MKDIIFDIEKLADKNGFIKPENLALTKHKDETTKIIDNKTFKDNILWSKTSDFHCIDVCENEIGRFINFSNTYQAGYINTPNYKGNLPYLNYFLLPYLYSQNIKKLLLIGLGTGKLINDISKLYQNTLIKSDVVDIEENMPFIAGKFFNFIPPQNYNFYLQDAIVYLKNNKNKYNLIEFDVAGDEGLNSRFYTEEFLSQITKNLTKNGLFLFNTCASLDFENKNNKFFDFQITLFKKFFKNIAVFKGITSDKIYYKSFFNIDNYVSNATNVIFIASNKNLKIKKEDKLLNEIKNMLGIDLTDYYKDLYKIY